MKIEGKLSKRGLLSIARHRYVSYRKTKKESKVYIGVLFAMCEGVCPSCGVKMTLSFDSDLSSKDYSATLDHTIPLSEELEHKKFGLEIMCRKCNTEKGNKII